MKTIEQQDFRTKFLAGETLYGTFLKVPATMPAEILGSIGYDFVVVDEEHSPFNRETTDRIVLACKAAGIASVVRVQSADPANILSVLDCGADGILVPHVTDAETARAIVSAGGIMAASADLRQQPVPVILDVRAKQSIWQCRISA